MATISVVVYEQLDPKHNVTQDTYVQERKERYEREDSRHSFSTNMLKALFWLLILSLFLK